MQRSEVSGAVRPIYGSLGVKRLKAQSTRCLLDVTLMCASLDIVPRYFNPSRAKIKINYF